MTCRPTQSHLLQTVKPQGGTGSSDKNAGQPSRAPPGGSPALPAQMPAPSAPELGGAFRQRPPDYTHVHSTWTMCIQWHRLSGAAQETADHARLTPLAANSWQCLLPAGTSHHAQHATRTHPQSHSAPRGTAMLSTGVYTKTHKNKVTVASPHKIPSLCKQGSGGFLVLGNIQNYNWPLSY